MSKRKGKRELPGAEKVGPVEFGLSGGGGAGRFGRVRVRGTTAAAREEKRVEQKEQHEHERESTGGRNVTAAMSGNHSQRRPERTALIYVCLLVALADFLSSSSSLSLKSSRLPISVGLTLIRLARLCMSSSLRNKDKHLSHVITTF